jgi:hypothetical protein
MSACCMTVRDCAPYLPDVLSNVNRLRTLFPTFSLIVAYDHCSDASEKILRQHKQRASYPVYLLPTEETSPLRTVRIAHARNRCLETLDTLNVSIHFMVDADDVNQDPWNLTLLRYYLSQIDWDALSFHRPSYYDLWALMYSPFQYPCWGFGIHSREVVRQMKEDIEQKLKRRHSLFPCESAFNGFAIYRTSLFQGIRYSGLTRDVLPWVQEALTEKAVGFPTVPFEQSCEHLYYHLKSGARIRISPYCL